MFFSQEEEGIYIKSLGKKKDTRQKTDKPLRGREIRVSSLVVIAAIQLFLSLHCISMCLSERLNVYVHMYRESCVRGTDCTVTPVSFSDQE